ncbi:hypothetical protein DLREEDagrD3_22960 [Denitratisoma sp. agr-D3]
MVLPSGRAPVVGIEQSFLYSDIPMYLNHFGLNELPFRITPHTEFFFSGANRGSTLDALLYAITHDEGIVKVSGEVGSGKTMLCRVLMERLPASVAIVYLANPSLSRDDILYAIADELNLHLTEGMRPNSVLRQLQEHLTQLNREEKRVVILVDEAHAMPVEALEEIRLLSNLESKRHKLLHLVLFGQPEINDILARPDMRQLKERITHNFLLEPLVRDDVAEYIEFRLRAAGYRGPNVFSPQSTRLIAEASLGLTRRINILADKTLLAAFSENTHQITAKHVRTAIKDCDFSPATLPGYRPPQQARPYLAATIALTLIGATYLLTKFSGQDGEPPQAPSSAQAQPAPAEQPPMAAVPAPVTPPAAAPVVAVATGAPSAPVTTPVASPEASKPAVPTPQASTPTAATNPLWDTALASGSQWIKTAPTDRWFIQLFSVDASKMPQVETFLTQAKTAGLDMGQTRGYQSDLSGRMRLGVIYGDYGSAQEAHQAIAHLPPAIQSSNPFARPIKQLR